MRQFKAMVLAGIMLAALAPAVSVQATHSDDHTTKDTIDGLEWAVCGGSRDVKEDFGANARYPANILTPNPAAKTGRTGVTQLAFQENDQLSGIQQVMWQWDYLQGFDGLVFRVVREDNLVPSGLDWKAASVENQGDLIYDITAKGNSLSNQVIDITLAFYAVEFIDRDGDAVQDPDEEMEGIDYLGSENAQVDVLEVDPLNPFAEFSARLTGEFPADTTHFIVSLASGGPRLNAVHERENTIFTLGSLQTTVGITAKVRDTTNDGLSCQDPIQARCLQDLVTEDGGDLSKPSIRDKRDGDNPSTASDERDNYEDTDSVLTRTINCPSIQRLI